MVTERQAQEIKQTCYSLSDLEVAGIFTGEEASLSDREQKTLHFINSLNQQQAGQLLLFLDNAESLQEKGAEDVFSDQRYRRDCERLAAQGLDSHDKESLAFAYGLLSEKLRGSKGHLGDYARMKALSQTERTILPQPEEEKPVSLATLSLQDLVEREVQKVERYLTSYFQVVDPLIRDFLPLVLEVEGRKKWHCMTVEASYNLSDQLAGYLSFNRLTDHYARHPLAGQEFVFSNDKITGAQVRLRGPNRYNSSVVVTNDKSLFPGVGIYGPTIELPDYALSLSTEWELKATATFQLTEDGIVFQTKKAKASRFAEEIFLRNSKGWILSKQLPIGITKLNMVRLYLCPDLGKLEAGDGILYTRDWKKVTLRIYRNGDKHTFVDPCDEVGLIVDWDGAVKNAKPLFWLNNFSAKNVTFSNSKDFWETLYAYARLPLVITEQVTERLKDNILEAACIPLESIAHQTREQLGYLRQTIEEVQAKGLLAGEQAPKLLEEAIES